MSQSAADCTVLSAAFLIRERFSVDWGAMTIAHTRQIGPLKSRFACATHAWEGTADGAEDEIALEAGELVELLDTKKDWWVGRTYHGAVGAFPRNYVVEETAIQHVARAKLTRTEQRPEGAARTAANIN